MDDRKNSLIMEQASETAELLALKDWGEANKGFFVEDADGVEILCDEAQDLFNEYYDQQMEQLTKLVKNCLDEKIQ